jgi:hypothetical protein
MSEIADDTQPFFSPDNDRFILHVSPELEVESQFRLLPFDRSNFPENKLAITRAETASTIKESLQDYTRLEGSVREFREVSTRGDYIWAIVTDLGMTTQELPTKSYREMFNWAHETAKDIKSTDIGELMDKYEEHPALGFIDTLERITPGTSEVKREIVMLRRTLLVLLNEAS